MKKKLLVEQWLSRFNAELGRELDPVETAIFEGAFELGWDAAENDILAEGIELDEFRRTDEQLEFEVNDLRERSV